MNNLLTVLYHVIFILQNKFCNFCIKIFMWKSATLPFRAHRFYEKELPILTAQKRYAVKAPTHALFFPINKPFISYMVYPFAFWQNTPKKEKSLVSQGFSPLFYEICFCIKYTIASCTVSMVMLGEIVSWICSKQCPPPTESSSSHSTPQASSFW